MAILIKHVDVSAGTGQIIHPDDKVSADDTIFRITLPRDFHQRSMTFADLRAMSPIDRSTVARLCGQELPRKTNAGT